MPFSVTRAKERERILLTAKSDSLSHMISCDTSRIVNFPLTLVPSLAMPLHSNITLQSKIVISLHDEAQRGLRIKPFKTR